jgi:hypothetical protein
MTLYIVNGCSPIESVDPPLEKPTEGLAVTTAASPISLPWNTRVRAADGMTRVCVLAELEMGRSDEEVNGTLE